MKPFDLNNLPAGLAGSTQDANTTQLFESARWSWRIGGLALLVLAVLCPPVRSTASAIAAGACAAQDDYEKLEAVLDTSRGQIVLEFFPAKHPSMSITSSRRHAKEATTALPFTEWSRTV